MVRNSSPFRARSWTLPTPATGNAGQRVYESDMNVAEPFDRESALRVMIDASSMMAMQRRNGKRRIAMKYVRGTLWAGLLALAACNAPPPVSSGIPGMPGMPGVPGLPSPSLPSPGLPSPSLPSPGLPSPGGSPSPPSPGSQSEIPSTGPQGGGGSPGDRRSPGDQGQDGGQGQERDQGQDGDQGRPGNGGWETSNETPGSSGTRPDGGSAGRPESDDSGGGPDSELDRALEVFDGQILSERQAILSRRNETAGQRPQPEPPESEDKGDDDSGGQGGPMGGNNSEPPPAPPPKLPIPPDVADAQDDDVVCRQIREAAIAETDAELREALWEEYRRCGGRR